jgi:hypothetical protein
MILRHPAKKKPPVLGLAVFVDSVVTSSSNPLDRLRREIEEPEKIRGPAIHGQMLA